MANFPYFTEPTHDRGTVTNDSSNATRDTQISENEGRLKLDVDENISLLDPVNTPMVTFLTNIGKTWNGSTYQGQAMLKRMVVNPEFKVQEDVYGTRYAKVSGTYAASGSVAPTVVGAGSSSGNIFTVGDVVINARTSERMLVTAVTATTVTFGVRSLGATAAAAGADGDGLYIIGNASEENSVARNVNTTRVSQPSNFTQIFKTTVSVSGTEKEVDLYGPADLTFQRAKKAVEHTKDIEKALWFGEKGEETGGTQGKPRRYTGGILEHVSGGNSYVQDQSGSLNAPDFNTFLREGFTYGSNRKILFCGGIVVQSINEFCRGQLQTRPQEQTYGVKVSEYVSAFGDIKIVKHPDFVVDWAGYAFLLDMDSYKYAFMKNRDTKFLTNVQAPDVDGEIDQYITECGLDRKQAARNALLKGVID